MTATAPLTGDRDWNVLDSEGERLGLSIVLVVIAALALGLVLVFSTSASTPIVRGGQVDWRHPFVMQGLYAVVSLTAILVVARIPYRKLKYVAPFALVAVVALLIALQIPGVSRPIKGATRWFRIGPVGIQPSEFAKIGLLLFLAWFLGRSRDPLRSFFTGFVPVVAVIAGIVGLIAIQPDFGMSLFIAALGGFLLLLAGARVLHLAGVGLCLGVPFAMLMWRKFDHIQERITSFRDPMAHYNTEHSLLALGSGGLYGVGLGNGREKLAYLPESSSDFIFSVLGEELGFLGACAVLLLYVVFLWKGVRIAWRAPDTFGFYLAAGAMLLVGLQAMIHIAVATASVPTKGIPLPFISVGGSNLLSLSIGVGILASVARYSPAPQRGT